MGAVVKECWSHTCGAGSGWIPEGETCQSCGAEKPGGFDEWEDDGNSIAAKSLDEWAFTWVKQAGYRVVKLKRNLGLPGNYTIEEER